MLTLFELIVLVKKPVLKNEFMLLYAIIQPKIVGLQNFIL